MPTILVKCPNAECRHRFPVNLDKHLNRRERYCPRCKTPINVRPKFWFSPNPDWSEQKQREAGNRRFMKQRARREQPQPAFALPFINEFLASLMIKRRMEKEAEKNENHSESTVE